MDMFAVFSTCLKGERASAADIDQINSWMFARWLGGDPRTVQIANAINQCYNMPVDAQYNFAREMLHGKIKFIRFPKKDKQVEPKLMQAVAERYKCDPCLVPELLSLMSADELQRAKNLIN